MERSGIEAVGDGHGEGRIQRGFLGRRCCFYVCLADIHETERSDTLSLFSFLNPETDEYTEASTVDLRSIVSKMLGVSSLGNPT